MTFKPEQIVECLWFHQHDQSVVGIVLYDTLFGHKAYVGHLPRSTSSEQIDAMHILETGCRFPGEKLWPYIRGGWAT